MQAFELSDLLRAHKEGGRLWYQYLRVPSLFSGIYSLPAGSKDPQSPHATDEVYYTISGRGVINVAGADRPVKAGSIVYVKAKDEHHFHSITQDLTLLVFFAGTPPPAA